MKDFTKEELKDMAEGLSVMWSEYVGVSEQHDLDRWHALLDRLRSMIDNYCEHNEGYVQDSMMVDICKKCKEIF